MLSVAGSSSSVKGSSGIVGLSVGATGVAGPSGCTGSANTDSKRKRDDDVGKKVKVANLDFGPVYGFWIAKI